MKPIEDDPGRWLVTPVVLLFVIVLFRTAWLCDDAFITFRTIDHWLDGNGLVFNLGERVQAFTHPLWMLGIGGLFALTGDIYFAPLVASIVVD